MKNNNTGSGILYFVLKWAIFYKEALIYEVQELIIQY